MPSPQYRHHVRVRRDESEHNSSTKGVAVVAQPPRPSRLRSCSETHASKCGYLLAHRLALHETDEERPLHSTEASYRPNLQAPSLRCLPDRQGKETNRRCLHHCHPQRNASEDRRLAPRRCSFHRSIRILGAWPSIHRSRKGELRKQVRRRHHLLRSRQRIHPMLPPGLSSRYRHRHLKKGLRARRKVVRKGDQELPRRQRCLQVQRVRR